MVAMVRWFLGASAIAVMSVNGACGGPPASSATDGDMRETATRTLLVKASKAVAAFHAKHQKAPSSIKELVAARLLHIQKATDPWGQTLELVVKSHDPKQLDVCSAGPDTAPGTDDDMCQRTTF